MRIVFALIFAHTIFADSIGSLLFHGNCTMCHFEKKEVSAPAMIDVQRVYKKAYPSKDEFVKNMIDFVKNPSKKTALMPQKIKKHGIMPHLGYDEETLKDIVVYLYDVKF